MHLTRHKAPLHIPIPRKGTKYVARPSSHVESSITVLGAVRDMLHIAHTTREVTEMIKNKSLKLNGVVVRDFHQSLQLFNILEADKRYVLMILPTGRFTLKEAKGTTRIAKVVNKKILRGKVTQVNLHDGTNLLHKAAVAIGDSVELDHANKIVKVLPLEKGKKAFIISGRSMGHEGVVKAVKDKIVDIEFGGKTVSLKEGQVIAL